MDDKDVTARLLELEERLLDASFRKNSEAVRSLLTEDFQEFGSSGKVFSREDVLQSLQQEAPAAITLSGFAVQQLSSEIALVTYRSRRVVPDGSDSTSSIIEALRSSIWIRKEGRWMMVFHQGTRTGKTEAHG